MSLTPFSLGTLLFLGTALGLFIALLGATLFFAVQDKKAAATVLVLGLMLVVGTLALYFFS